MEADVRYFGEFGATDPTPQDIYDNPFAKERRTDVRAYRKFSENVDKVATGAIAGKSAMLSFCHGSPSPSVVLTPPICDANTTLGELTHSRMIRICQFYSNATGLPLQVCTSGTGEKEIFAAIKRFSKWVELNSRGWTELANTEFNPHFDGIMASFGGSLYEKIPNVPPFTPPLNDPGPESDPVNWQFNALTRGIWPSLTDDEPIFKIDSSDNIVNEQVRCPMETGETQCKYSNDLDFAAGKRIFQDGKRAHYHHMHIKAK